MATAALKTRPTGASVEAFLEGIADDRRRQEARALDRMMREVTGAAPALWGPSIVGYGSYHYRYASGREGDWMLTGFSPRKTALTVYVMAGFERYEALLARLGRYTTGKSCLYLKSLDGIDAAVLRELVERSVAHMRELYPDG